MELRSTCDRMIRTLLAAGCLLVLPAVTADAKVRDQSLPSKPKNIADLFIVDTYPNTEGNFYTDWFCSPNGAFQGKKKKCTSNSQAAFDQLLSDMKMEGLGRPTLLRVGKARDDCEYRQLPPKCGTGVPPPPSLGCSEPRQAPYCALRHLKERNIANGVVMGAREDDEARSVRDLTWQACQIHKADRKSMPGRDDGLYDFLFLDQARYLGNSIRAAVRHINEGAVWDGKRYSKTCTPGWDVITNDNGWRGHPLDTQAWGHAKHYVIAKRTERLENAANDGGPFLRPDDVDFVRAVNQLEPKDGLTTGPILRVEIPKQTSHLAAIKRWRQCAVLRGWARAQTEASGPFAALYPLYNAGKKSDSEPYDSYMEGTSYLQMALMENPKSKVGCRAGDGAPPDQLSQPVDPTAPDPAGDAQMPAPSRPPQAAAPELRAPGVGPEEPSAVTCNSARLNGWVNPHGSSTSFHFEYWKRGDVTNAHPTGTGDAGAGNDRVGVFRIVHGLERDTGYTGKLIASNAAGRAVSDIFSFTTNKRC
jgi:hypothetical protein